MSALVARTARPAGDRLAAAILTGFVVLSLAPVALADIPAMVDYPNHMARMAVLMRDGTPAANPYYEVRWALYPNLAMDLLVPPLGRWFGIEAATRLFCLAAQMLVVTGSMALSFAVRRGVAGAAVTASLALYSIPFAWGFLNFEFALGLALWGLAVWIALEPARPALRWAVHAVFVALLFVCHLFALGLYGVALATIELHRMWDGRLSRRAIVTSLAALGAPFAAVGAAMMASGGSVGGARTVWAFEAKLGWLFALNGYDRTLSMVLTACLAMLGYVVVRQGWLRLAGAGPWLATAFVLVYVATPFRLFDTAFVDVRVLVAAALMLPAFARLTVPPGRARIIAGGIVAVAAAINLSSVILFQQRYGRDYASVVAALKQLPAGSRVLVADAGDAPDPPSDLSEYPMYHAATLAVVYADGFVPTLFTYPGKQPILPRPAFRSLAVREGGPIPMADLVAIAAGAAVPPSLAHVARWTRDFDYVFLLRPDGASPLPGSLEAVAAGARFALYRVCHPARYTRP